MPESKQKDTVVGDANQHREDCEVHPLLALVLQFLNGARRGGVGGEGRRRGTLDLRADFTFVPLHSLDTVVAHELLRHTCQLLQWMRCSGSTGYS